MDRYTFTCTCAACGRELAYSMRDPVYKRPYIEIKNNKYCLNCYEWQLKIQTEPCRKCGKQTHLNEFTAMNMCPDCWKGHMTELRKAYEPWERMLRKALSGYGIKTVPNSVKDLNDLGQPEVPVKDINIKLLPLRDKRINKSYYAGNEYAIYKIPVKDGELALSDNGISLRYIKPCSDMVFMNSIAELVGTSGYNLAAVSDGENIYVLTDRGVIRHTNAALEGDIKVFDPDKIARDIWNGAFSEKELKEATRKYQTSGKHHLLDDIYYDADNCRFIEESTYGSMHEGYETIKSPITKDEAFKKVLYRPGFSMIGLSQSCKANEIPVAAIIDRLAEK